MNSLSTFCTKKVSRFTFDIAIFHSINTANSQHGTKPVYVRIRTHTTTHR